MAMISLPRSFAPLLSLRRLLLALCWMAWAFMFVKYVLILPYIFPGVDFPKHHRAAVEIIHGRSPFTGRNFLGFNYPLFTAWVYSFLAPLSEAQAKIVWDVTNGILLLASLALLVCFHRPCFDQAGASVNAAERDSLAWRTRRWWARHWPSLAALMMAAYAPIFMDFHCGNVEPLNVILLIALSAAMLRGAERTAGVLLAILCLVKILPVLFILPFAVAGKRRVVWYCIGSLGLYGAVLLATGWWRWEWFLFTQTLPNVGFQYHGLSSSLTSIAGRMFFFELMKSKAAYDLASRVVAAGALGLDLAILAASWRAWRASWRDGLSVMSLSILLMTPLLEYHHIVWALPAYLLLFVDYIEGRIGARFFAWALALWLAIFACRYLAEISIHYRFPPRDAATLLLIVLWLSTAARIVCKQSRRRDEITRFPS